MINSNTQSDKKKCLHLRKILLKSMMLFRANLIRKKWQFLFKILWFIIQLSQGLHVEVEIQRRLQKKTPNLSHLWWAFSWEKRNLWTKDCSSLVQNKMWPLCPVPCHSESLPRKTVFLVSHWPPLTEVSTLAGWQQPPFTVRSLGAVTTLSIYIILTICSGKHMINPMANMRKWRPTRGGPLPKIPAG